MDFRILQQSQNLFGNFCREITDYLAEIKQWNIDKSGIEWTFCIGSDMLSVPIILASIHNLPYREYFISGSTNM